MKKNNKADVPAEKAALDDRIFHAIGVITGPGEWDIHKEVQVMVVVGEVVVRHGVLTTAKNRERALTLWMNRAVRAIRRELGEAPLPTQSIKVGAAIMKYVMVGPPKQSPKR